MKLTVPIEDLIIGIICGLLLIGYTERYFSLKLNNMVYVAAFIVYIVFIILDIVFEFSDLTTHFGFIVVSILHNLADLVLSLAFISHFSGWNMPYVTGLIVPYLQNEAFIFGAGMYLIAANVLWLAIYPFTY